jgi:hypothetical protein
MLLPRYEVDGGFYTVHFLCKIGCRRQRPHALDRRRKYKEQNKIGGSALAAQSAQE